MYKLHQVQQAVLNTLAAQRTKRAIINMPIGTGINMVAAILAHQHTGQCVFVTSHREIFECFKRTYTAIFPGKRFEGTRLSMARYSQLSEQLDNDALLLFMQPSFFPKHVMDSIEAEPCRMVMFGCHGEHAARLIQFGGFREIKLDLTRGLS